MKHNKYTTYAYIKVSSKDQNEHRQLLEMRKLGIKDSHIYMDKLSGKDFNRPSYKKLVYEVLKKDDLLVVKSIDRLGRNYHEILDEWKVITKQIGAQHKDTRHAPFGHNSVQRPPWNTYQRHSTSAALVCCRKRKEQYSSKTG